MIPITMKAPHLESIIKSQRIMVCKRFADEEPCAWKTILSHYLKSVRDKIILCCDFDVKRLPINLPSFYQKCLKCFTQCSAAAYESEFEMSHEEISNTVIWNNKFIFINGKSVFNIRLTSKGLIRIGDLVTEGKQFISQCNVRQRDFSPKDVFDLMALIDAIPAPWRQSLKMSWYVNKTHFVLHDQIQLVLNNQNVLIDKALSKSIYRELISGLVTLLTAQLRCYESFDNVCLEWKEIYSLPFKVALDTKSREFQYKVLNRYLVTNNF